jgi:hypothetical protein
MNSAMPATVQKKKLRGSNGLSRQALRRRSSASSGRPRKQYVAGHAQAEGVVRIELDRDGRGLSRLLGVGHRIGRATFPGRQVVPPR